GISGGFRENGLGRGPGERPAPEARRRSRAAGLCSDDAKGGGSGGALRRAGSARVAKERAAEVIHRASRILMCDVLRSTYAYDTGTRRRSACHRKAIVP